MYQVREGLEARVVSPNNLSVFDIGYDDGTPLDQIHARETALHSENVIAGQVRIVHYVECESKLVNLVETIVVRS